MISEEDRFSDVIGVIVLFALAVLMVFGVLAFIRTTQKNDKPRTVPTVTYIPLINAQTKDVLNVKANIGDGVSLDPTLNVISSGVVNRFKITKQMYVEDDEPETVESKVHKMYVLDDERIFVTVAVPDHHLYAQMYYLNQDGTYSAENYDTQKWNLLLKSKNGGLFATSGHIAEYMSDIIRLKQNLCAFSYNNKSTSLNELTLCIVHLATTSSPGFKVVSQHTIDTSNANAGSENLVINVGEDTGRILTFCKRADNNWHVYGRQVNLIDYTLVTSTNTLTLPTSSYSSIRLYNYGNYTFVFTLNSTSLQYKVISWVNSSISLSDNFITVFDPVQTMGHIVPINSDYSKFAFTFVRSIENQMYLNTYSILSDNTVELLQNNPINLNGSEIQQLLGLSTSLTKNGFIHYELDVNFSTTDVVHLLPYTINDDYTIDTGIPIVNVVDQDQNSLYPTGIYYNELNNVTGITLPNQLNTVLYTNPNGAPDFSFVKTKSRKLLGLYVDINKLIAVGTFKTVEDTFIKGAKYYIDENGQLVIDNDQGRYPYVGYAYSTTELWVNVEKQDNLIFSGFL